MIGLASLRWAPADTAAALLARDLRLHLVALGWSCPIEDPGWMVLVQPMAASQSLVTRATSTRVIVGYAFDTRATSEGIVRPATSLADDRCFETACGDFARDAWGAYLILEVDPNDPRGGKVFRDPIGRIDTICWSCRGLTIITSAAGALLDHAAPPDLDIDWAMVGDVLRFPGAACETLPLRGVVEIPSGVLFDVATRSPITRIWSAAAAARQPPPQPGEARDILPRLVDACVAAWATTTRRSVAELSGGLDSAIIAAALSRAPAPAVAGWFNYHLPDREGDERVFASAVAEHLGIPLSTVPRDAPVLDQALLDHLPVDVRPNIAGVGLVHDRHLALEAQALGADALFTGHGGDALFFQFPSASLATDVLRARRSFCARRAMFEALAGWTDRSIWSLLGTALRERLAGPPDLLPDLPVDLTNRLAPREPPRRTWLNETARLPASKRLQILSLSAARSTFTGAWSAASLSVLHPLLSQPLLNYALPIPALELTEARRDRALIRRAYAGRLPDKLLARRGKGSATKAYGRAVAASVPFLRTYLLDGELATHGVLDLDLIDTLLDPEQLMLHDSYTAFLTLLFMERWARVWTGRIASLRARTPETP